jgi:hypothetical protein
MKRFVALVSILSLLGIAACGGSATEAETTPTAPEPAPATEMENQAPVADEAAADPEVDAESADDLGEDEDDVEDDEGMDEYDEYEE